MTKRKNRLSIIILILVVIAAAGAIFWVKPMYDRVYKPNVIVKNGQERFIYVRTGYSLKELQQYFYREHILKDTASFGWMARRMHYAGHLKPGRYRVSDKMNNLVLVRLLRSGQQVPVKLTFLNVRYKEQLAGLAGKYLEADSSRILQLLNDDSYLTKYGVNSENVMTLVISDTYEFDWNTSSADFLKRIYTESSKIWTSARLEEAKQLGMTPQEIVTLASIVQEETAHKDEAKMIAGVYLNRLKKGMMLQADPTIKYIRMAKSAGSKVQRIYLLSSDASSPYNTYKKKGLPPGPVVSTQLWAIDAVLNPAQHDYLYFVAKDDFSGYSVFSRTLEEHNAHSRKYREELNRRNIH